jgi:diadenosine tetraphosphate (Ap4A) HIT family hydrolase
MTGAESLYYVPAGRSVEQREYMESLEARGICIFCEEHVAEHQKHPVEETGEFWYITRNSYPYEGTVAHYLIVPREHVSSFDALPDAAGSELWSFQRLLKARHAPLATATVMRSGDMRYNGGSVAHLHVHFVVLDDAPAATVRFKVSA